MSHSCEAVSECEKEAVALIGSAYMERVADLMAVCERHHSGDEEVNVKVNGK